MARRKIYASQIQTKIDQLRRERQQVLRHLALVDDKLATLTNTLAIMQETRQTAEYNTPLFVYRTHQRHFRQRLRPMVLSILKANPTQRFTLQDLTQQVLELDEQTTPPTVQQQHSVRGVLTYFLRQGWVMRYATNVIDVKWQWKGE